MLASRWVRQRSMGVPPCPRRRHSCVCVGVQVYVFGGSDATGQVLDDMFVLHTPTLAWSKVPPRGCTFGARQGHSCVHVPALSSLALFGGKDDAVHHNQLALFDIPSGNWINPSCSGHTPIARWLHGCCVTHSGHMVVYGGVCEEGPLGDVCILDTATFAWTSPTYSSGPNHRADMAMVYAGDDRCLVFGGTSGVSTSFSGDTWQLTLQRKGQADAGVQDEQSGQASSNEISAIEWNKINSSGAPGPRAGHSMVCTHATRVWIFGGRQPPSRLSLFNSTPSILDEVHCFDACSQQWQRVQHSGGVQAPARQHAGMCAVDSSTVLMFGGSNAVKGSTQSAGNGTFLSDDLYTLRIHDEASSLVSITEFNSVQDNEDLRRRMADQAKELHSVAIDKQKALAELDALQKRMRWTETTMINLEKELSNATPSRRQVAGTAGPAAATATGTDRELSEVNSGLSSNCRITELVYKLQEAISRQLLDLARQSAKLQPIREVTIGSPQHSSGDVVDQAPAVAVPEDDWLGLGELATLITSSIGSSAANSSVEHADSRKKLQLFNVTAEPPALLHGSVDPSFPDLDTEQMYASIARLLDSASSPSDLTVSESTAVVFAWILKKLQEAAIEDGKFTLDALKASIGNDALRGPEFVPISHLQSMFEECRLWFVPTSSSGAEEDEEN